MSNKTHGWRKSACIILVAKTEEISKDGLNYRVLTLDRLDTSSHYPGATVFPGGLLETSDASKEWLDLFEKHGFTFDSLQKLEVKKSKPLIYCANDANDIPSYLSLRIAAIREVFEETGILLCRNAKASCGNTQWANYIKSNDILEWQSKIQQNPKEFWNFCWTFNLCPDLWSLHEWSNWRSPLDSISKFDTMYFLAATQQVPQTFANKAEAQQLQWATPQDYLDQLEKEKILFYLPQFYEFSRLKVFSDINRLIEFARKREPSGIKTITTVRAYTNDIFCFILPGDDLYPTIVDAAHEVYQYDDAIPETFIQHRIYMKSFNELSLVTKNFTPQCNHVLPINSKI
ncbi:hypothetical protein FQA39_LY04765 [Lamprigera yunnana]|nr:hypothetical protein FQA39_LY04765 [Lamprigera yunnana]